MTKGKLLQWNGGRGNRLTHDLFKFPGKFHPPLVEQVLSSFEPKGVIDPMAGVGTVAVEAKAAGIPSLSLDIDPVSVFFAKVKTTPIPEPVLRDAWRDLSASLERHMRPAEEIEQRMFRDLRHDRMRRRLARMQAQDLARLSYWFRRYVLVDYARIHHSIHNGGLPDQNMRVRRFFLACLLSSVRRISNADPSPVSGLEITKHMREKIDDGYPIDVFGEFSRRVENAIQQMAEYNSHLEETKTAATAVHVHRQDALRLQQAARKAALKWDLILFSPPYCNAIEYWRRHRLEYLVGGFLDEDGVVDLSHKFVGRTTVGGKAREPGRIGFRSTDSLIRHLWENERKHKAQLLWQYFSDMRERLAAFHEASPSGGHCVIVVGDSQTAGRRVSTANTLTFLAEEVGFEHVQTSRYTIKNRVMQYPTKTHDKIQKESVIVLRKEKV